MTRRTVLQHWQALSARDGAGVNLQRALGARPEMRLDPFLMLDNFASDDPNDYSAGFPAHPHRGFETVTYIIDGHMKHRDHLGNEGDLKAGGVQWMTAGRGIIHEEMPQQTDGLLRGFQLWLNLPAKDKMQVAHYKDVPAASMPWQALKGGGRIKLIAGKLLEDKSVDSGQDTHALQADASRVTAPIIADVCLVAGSATLALPAQHQALVYVFEGDVTIEGQHLRVRDSAVLSQGGALRIEASGEARLLLIAGQPLNEPVVQYGPFVMNTAAEIDAAISDYRDGSLTA